MDRRDFLKKCAFVSSASLVGGLNIRNVLAHNAAFDTLSISVLTNSPDKAIDLVEEALTRSQLRLPVLVYSERVLPGSYLADIAVVKNGRLLNYKEDNDPMATEIRSVADALALPQQIEDPVLVTISTRKQGAADRFTVSHRGQLVSEFKMDEDRNVELSGSHGAILLTISDGRAWIKDASCRHKTCMRMGQIRKPGQLLVCIPNQLMISMAGEHEAGIDALAF